MEQFLIRIAVNAVALWVAGGIVGGIDLTSSIGGLLLVALIFGVVNALIKPVALFLSFPAIIITLGLFALVVNAGMLGLTAAVTDNLDIDGFWSAVFGAIVISVVSWAISMFLPEDKKPNKHRSRQ